MKFLSTESKHLLVRSLPNRQAARSNKYLQTKLSENKLNDGLLRIFRKASSLFEEQGISTLFIALGMLSGMKGMNQICF